MQVYKLKILLCGPAAVGKTSLIHRFIKSKFATDYKLTVGVDILTKEVEYEPGKTATLSIWDIGGQERFSFIRTTFYKGASGVLLVFDLSRAETWGLIKNWRDEVTQFAGNVPFVLIGNKVDLIPEIGEVIDRDECRRYAEEENSVYIEASAKSGVNVDESFTKLTQLIIERSA
jgi:small GTP-binding protein